MIKNFNHSLSPLQTYIDHKKELLLMVKTPQFFQKTLEILPQNQDRKMVLSRQTRQKLSYRYFLD